jgi:hypothetical protein
MDFTLKSYNSLLRTLTSQGFSFISFEQFLSNPAKKVVVLRHDVDLLPENSLRFAKIESDYGFNGTYYFRIVDESFNEKIIKEIYSLGHEIGYHYEEVNQASGFRRQASGIGRRTNDTRCTEEEIVKIAIESFKKNLAKLRELVPVKTICMHGSPMSKWDSRLLWKYYDYHDYGIVGEPYFDIDFDEILYLTDTGRRWDGNSFNIRDRASGVGRRESGEESPAPRTPHPAPFPKFHSSFDIIRAAEEGKLPEKIMMTFHPQRWTDQPVPWVKELVWQNTKNVGKFLLKKVRSKK